MLLLTPFPPRVDGDHGGTRVLAQLVRGFSARHRVAVLTLRHEGEPPMTPQLARLCAAVEEVELPAPPRSSVGRAGQHAARLLAAMRATPPWVHTLRSDSYAERVVELARRFEPEVVQAHFEVMAQYLPALGDSAAARVLVVDEPDTVAAALRVRSARGPRRLAREAHLRAWRRFERRALAGADAAVALTEADRAVLEAHGVATPVCTIPLTTVLPPRPLDPLGATPSTVVFVGNFVHAPNVEAALSLLRDILPLARTELPELRACVVGRDPPDELRRLADELTTVTGFVPDVTPYLDRATVVVAPIWSGGGMRVKVLETLAAGKALVATPRALEGLAVDAGEHAVVAATHAAFSRGIVELVADPGLRERVAAAGRRWAVANLGQGPEIELYERLWELAIAARRARGRR